MKIRIEDYCDGFCIIVDGERFHIYQEDDRSILEEVFKKVSPNSNIEYEEVY